MALICVLLIIASLKISPGDLLAPRNLDPLLPWLLVYLKILPTLIENVPDKIKLKLLFPFFELTFAPLVNLIKIDWETNLCRTALETWLKQG